MLTDRAGLDPATFAALTAVVAGHRTLGDVARWCGARRSRLLDVVTQDEYTHDVIVHYEGPIHLVYDTT